MKKIGLILLILIIMTPVFAQDEFVFDKNVDKISVPIKVINNLVLRGCSFIKNCSAASFTF